ncbi:MAG TPA: cupin domain-containing protein [Blastocatellia bacterium]|nr:cupin domain-containing protein [Blastocatellia bacterium]
MEKRKSVWGPNEGKKLSILGDPFTCKAVGENTNNSWSLFEATVMPGSVVPNHKHDGFDEAFYLLEGELEMWLDGETINASPGHLVNFQRGTVHGYQNKSGAPARYLTWTHPAGIEHFYEEMSSNVKSMPEDLNKILEISDKHNIQIMPPKEG